MIPPPSDEHFVVLGWRRSANISEIIRSIVTMAEEGSITLRGYGYSIHVWPSNVQLTALHLGAIV